MQREVVEVCPHCGNENVWDDLDPVKNDYKAVCKECGKEIFLCDECMNAEDNPGQRCNWYKGKCFRGEIKE